MKQFQNSLFLQLFVVWLVIGGAFLFSYSSKDLHLTLNNYHHPFTDWFFRYLTHFGDGIIASIVTLIFFFFNKKWGIIVALSWLLTSGLTQLLKRLVFYESHRPFKYFEGIYDLYLVPGVEMNSSFSFPSGHATTSFALYCAIALLTKNKALQVVLFLFAFLCAYSRVYLSQHFFIDIFVGSIIGTLGTVLIFNLTTNYLPEKLNQALFSKK